ncbi:putative SGNH hydrolase-type esterase domain-containing protein [Seiridium cardinale]|uniref:SGNH hydrolase-type esterase domain-containing protein n=1 Tax=Seiridium cardinale TaxID=138064 RepID=A0ABR2X7D9_9PEZI
MGGGDHSDKVSNPSTELDFAPSIDVERVRFQISNTFGGSDLPITAASIALPTGGKAGFNGIGTASLMGLTFSGSNSATIPEGQVAYTDPVNFKAAAPSMIAINLYFQAGQSGGNITGHPGSGRHHGCSRAITLMQAKLPRSGVTNIAVNNQAAGGNTVFTGGLGPPLMQRYQRGLLQTAGIKYAIILEGVNDIGDQLISSFKQIATDAHKAGVKVFGATITPFGGNWQSYSNPTRDATRQRVNQSILGGGDGSLDGSIDFTKILVSSGNAATLASQYDSGDHLHPNPAGYQAIADTFPVNIFQGNATL